jgi:hydrogenase maturation protease
VSKRCEARVIGLGNVLWADEGFGVRAVEALNERYTFAADVDLLDGGTLGLNLYEPVANARRLLVLDAIDFGLAPGTLKVLRGDDVPAWGATKLSPHQTGFNDILALVRINGREPEMIVVVGVQPLVLDDFGGSLREPVKAKLAEAVELAANELAAWGFPGTRREGSERAPALNAQALDLAAYEAQRPSETDACRRGDARVLAQASRQRAE